MTPKNRLEHLFKNRPKVEPKKVGEIVTKDIAEAIDMISASMLGNQCFRCQMSHPGEWPLVLDGEETAKGWCFFEPYDDGGEFQVHPLLANKGHPMRMLLCPGCNQWGLRQEKDYLQMEFSTGENYHPNTHYVYLHGLHRDDAEPDDLEFITAYTEQTGKEVRFAMDCPSDDLQARVCILNGTYLKMVVDRCTELHICTGCRCPWDGNTFRTGFHDSKRYTIPLCPRCAKLNSGRVICIL